MKLQPLTSGATFSTNLWMTRLASSTRLSRKSSAEPPPSVIRVLLQTAVGRVKAAGVLRLSLARVKEISVPSAAWLLVVLTTTQVIDRIVAR